MKKAVLIIHGLGGHPNEHKKIKKYLKEYFDVYTFLLPGHGNKLFNCPKKEQWIKASEKEIEELYKKGYSDIYVIGHSMGGVLASYLATKYDKIKKIVLEAPAYDYNSSLKLGLKIFKYYSPKYLFSTILHFSPSIIKEFKELITECEYCLKEITIPTLIIQGKDDIVVPYKTAKKIYSQILFKEKYLILIDDLPHALCEDKKYNDIMPIIKDFLKNKHFNNKKYDDILLQNKTR